MKAQAKQEQRTGDTAVPFLKKEQMVMLVRTAAKLAVICAIAYMAATIDYSGMVSKKLDRDLNTLKVLCER